MVAAWCCVAATDSKNTAVLDDYACVYIWCNFRAVARIIGQFGLENYDQLFVRRVTMSGRVSEDTDMNRNGQTILRLGDITIDEYALSGNA